MSYEEYEAAVVALVHDRLKDTDWYVGVVSDTIQGSYRNKDSIKDAAIIAEMETAYQDGPDLGEGWRGV